MTVIERKLTQVGQMSQIDYLTLTIREGDKQREIQESFEKYLDENKAAGFKDNGVKFGGFSGIHINKRQAASNPKSRLFLYRFIGNEAHTAFSLGGLDGAKATRVDLAVTIQLEKPYERYAWERWRKAKAIMMAEGRAEGVPVLISSPSGDTVQSVSRETSTFLRLYDRCFKMGLPLSEKGRYWRFECEFKRHLSNPVFAALNKTENVEDFISRTVYDRFSKAWLFPSFLPGQTETAIEIGTRITDDEKTLSWLRQTVSPAVERLKQNGKTLEAMTALNLRHFYKQGRLL